MEEVWKDIPEYEGKYQASTLGRIKSLSRKVWCGGGYRTMKGRILRPGRSTKHGHVTVALGRGNSQSVHILILQTFIGPRPKRFDGMHLNGDASANELLNLKWGTRSENNEMILYHNKRKLTVKNVKYIKRNPGNLSQTALAKKFNISLCAINDIIHERSYIHV